MSPWTLAPERDRLATPIEGSDVSSETAKLASPAHANAPPDRAAAPLGIQVLPPPIALVEIVALIVPFTLLDHFVASFPNLAEIQPHPFWLPVLLLSLQYGTLSGLLAASAAILATLFLGWPQQDVGENHFSYLLRIWTQPALWIGAALILGQFRLRQIERKLELQRLVAELTNQRNAVAEFAENLRARCDALERHLAGRRAPGQPGAVDAVARLASAPRNQLAPAFSRALTGVFGACKASLLVNAGEGLILEASTGRGEEAPRTRRIEPAEAIYRAVVIEGRALSVLAAGDERELAGRALIAVPVVATSGERVVGLLALEEVAPTELGETAVERLHLLAGVIAPMIERHAGVRVLASAGQRLTPASPRAKIWRRLRWQRTSEPALAARADAAAARQGVPR